MASVNVDFEQAGELKIGQVGIANLRVRTLDVPRLVQEMRERVSRAPKLFGRAAVILDFGGLSQVPDLATAKSLLEGLRDAGVLPVALAYGTSEIDLLSQQLGVPLLAKFRAQYEPSAVSPPPPPPPARAEPAPAAARPAPGRMQRTAVRSGQQLYAENCDLTVLSTVGAGAEVIADGSIHIYGTLRGRALAGAQGNPDARIFCRDFHAELVAIAGHYKVLDDVPMDLRGKAVQVWLEQDQIKIAALD
ncbi:septum site-determining protein MinC [Xanthomonas phaseoli pv. syngonii LMG 9055]|uniref:Probable septum site-determining protein MinC n=2 Tax=Xanthomonas phaseoli TaxID=1985254 RepID=A0AB34QM27_XANCH|nr:MULTISPECIES: septum site-determining protein MinC [Xanthomonas]OQP74997.1 septum site-determining protein MinC [Xanthomonas phaseoli pv. syngonii LMG 9055]ATS20547.1 septum site-determining protein MinC [Xanthomonas phaseoli pv. phaseoli]ATS27195.1 septum site-determining protein MinC [Xanthomonas phaseoli pv. phaseoli]ATS29353.1 septum site-determining protein MinC [Xanthomonas phaseoli pv. phaseoli]ATS35457.1 septum site-determining protein MinC [Xanthomonas phaseoli pv. phaseoli]